MRHPRRLAGVLCALGLMLPSSAAAHTVLPGETLSGIAAANGLTTEALAAANGLSPTAFAIAGTNLTIPAAGTTARRRPRRRSRRPRPGTAPAAGGHFVTPGETLSGIAAANGLSDEALASANGLSPTSFAIAGTTLRIPAAGSAPAPAAGSGTTPAARRPAATS